MKHFAIALILISSSALTAHAGKCIPYLQKPITPEELYIRLDHLAYAGAGSSALISDPEYIGLYFLLPVHNSKGPSFLDEKSDELLHHFMETTENLSKLEGSGTKLGVLGRTCFKSKEAAHSLIIDLEKLGFSLSAIEQAKLERAIKRAMTYKPKNPSFKSRFRKPGNLKADLEALRSFMYSSSHAAFNVVKSLQGIYQLTYALLTNRYEGRLLFSTTDCPERLPYFAVFSKSFTPTSHNQIKLELNKGIEKLFNELEY